MNGREPNGTWLLHAYTGHAGAAAAARNDPVASRLPQDLLQGLAASESPASTERLAETGPGAHADLVAKVIESQGWRVVRP